MDETKLVVTEINELESRYISLLKAFSTVLWLCRFQWKEQNQCFKSQAVLRKEKASDWQFDGINNRCGNVVKWVRGPRWIEFERVFSNFRIIRRLKQWIEKMIFVLNPFWIMEALGLDLWRSNSVWNFVLRFFV